MGLVDRFGGLSDAIAEAAKRAKLDPAKVQAVYLEKEPGWLGKFLGRLGSGDGDDDATGGDVFARIAADHQAVLARALGDMRRLTRASSIQARCLECGGLGPVAAPAQGDVTLLDMLIAKFAH